MPSPSSTTTTSAPSSTGDTVTVTLPVLDQVAGDLRELVGVDPHLRQRAVLVELEPVGRLTCSDARLEVTADGRGDIDDLLAQLQPAGLDAGDVEQLTDQSGDPV